MSDSMTSSQQAYALAPMSVVLDPNLSPGAVRLYMYLDWRQGKNPDCWPSVETMARELNISDDTACRWRAELEQNGYLTTTHEDGKPNHYSLHHRIERYIQAQEADESAPRKSAAPRTDAGTPPANLRPLPPANLRHEHDSSEQEQKQETVGKSTAPPKTAWGDLGKTRPDSLKGNLVPDTPPANELFDALEVEFLAAGRRPRRRRFETTKQKERFDTAAQVLGEDFSALLDKGLGEGINELRGLVDWVCGCATRRLNGQEPKPANGNGGAPKERPPAAPPTWETCGIAGYRGPGGRERAIQELGPGPVHEWEVSVGIQT